MIISGRTNDVQCLFMMVCECVSPPPEFNIPPPPDPSLIWHLLSDEPSDELQKIQQCDASDEVSTTSHNVISSGFSDLPNYLLHALITSGALISATLLFIIIYINIRKRCNRKEGGKRKRRSEYPVDIVLSNSDWPYSSSTTIRNSNSLRNGSLLYGFRSTESNFTKHKAVPVTPDSLRSYSYRPNKLSTNLSRKSPLQSGATFRIRESSDGYCTMGRLYEEIPESGIFNAMPPRNSPIFVSKRELHYGIPLVRRPPPTCRPPPPPSISQDSPISLGSSENSIERENNGMHKVSSLKHLTDDEKSPNSGNSGDNGHESGYGTAPSRSWNSPMIKHLQKRNSLSESEDIFYRQTPLTVYADQSNAHPMTYV